MTISIILIIVSVALASLRGADLFFSITQKKIFIAMVEDMTLKMSYWHPIDLFSKIARRPFSEIIVTLFVLSTYPLYRSVVLPLITFFTPGDAITLMSTLILSIFSVKGANLFTKSIITELSGIRERQLGELFTFRRFLFYSFKGIALLSSGFLLQFTIAYSLFWVLIIHWLGVEAHILRFAVVCAWPWIYFMLSILPAISFGVLAVLIQTCFKILLNSLRFVLWRSVEYKNGPLSYFITFLAFVFGVLGIYMLFK